MIGQPKNRYPEIENRAVLQVLLSRMLADSRLSSNHIALEIDRGVIRLSGEVSSYREKLAAQEIAEEAEGVRRVVNELKVCSDDPRAGDRQLADQVRDALRTAADVTKATVIVSVQDGKVTLTGTAGGLHERQIAEEIAQSVADVTEVANLILVDAERKVNDEELSYAIEAAVMHEEALRGQAIDVAVHDGQVVLTGRVERRGQRSVAQAVVERFGVSLVRNELAVDEEPQESSR